MVARQTSSCIAVFLREVKNEVRARYVDLISEVKTSVEDFPGLRCCQAFLYIAEAPHEYN